MRDAGRRPEWHLVPSAAQGVRAPASFETTGEGKTWELSGADER